MAKTFQDIHVPRSSEEIEYCLGVNDLFVCNLMTDIHNPFIQTTCIIYLHVKDRSEYSWRKSQYRKGTSLIYYIKFYNDGDRNDPLETMDFSPSWMTDWGETKYDPYGRESIIELMSPISDNLLNIFEENPAWESFLKCIAVPHPHRDMGLRTFNESEYIALNNLDKMAYIAFCLQEHQYERANHWEDDPKHIPEHDD